LIFSKVSARQMIEHHEPHVPRNLAGYLEAMTRIVFQSGMTWRVVQAKWPGIERAFHGFDPKRVAAMTPREIDRVMKDPDVIRSRPKIEAVVHNAKELVAIGQQRGGFRSYMRSLGAFDEAAPVLRKRFRYLGDHGTYYFLWQVGESVPDWDTFIGDRGGAAKRTGRRPSASRLDR
jgi:3-methyladenine DNA glycosylase Tag